MVQQIKTSDDQRRIDLDGRVLVAHQAEFMPWLGFISKAAMGDVYFILDTAQFTKKHYENRNKIRTKNDPGWSWITVPCKDIKNHYVQLNKVEIADDHRWKKKLLNTIKINYQKAPYFTEIYPEIENIIQKDQRKLVDINIDIIMYAFDKFGIKVPVYKTSTLIEEGYEINGTKNDLILSMCEAVNADVYVFGESGIDYCKKELFNSNGILPIFQSYKHPKYNQIYDGFKSHMSFIDLLFNYGDASPDILGRSEYILGSENQC